MLFFFELSDPLLWAEDLCGFFLGLGCRLALLLLGSELAVAALEDCQFGLIRFQFPNLSSDRVYQIAVMRNQ